MRVILTGASGFVGSYVLEELINNKLEVAIIIRESTDTWRIQSLLKYCTVIYLDINNYSQFQTEVTNFKPDVLMNLAWHGVANKARNDLSQLEINMSYLRLVVDACINANIKTILGVGSQAEYGVADAIINESSATNPSSLYGVAKLTAFHWLRVVCNQNNIRFIWHRIFSVYGPKDNDCWLIPMLIKKLLNNSPPDLTAGTQLWDYLYVQDAAKAIVSTILNSEISGVFNLGSGLAYKVKDIAEKLRNLINNQQKINFGAVPFRHDQIMLLQADISKLKQSISWQPVTSINSGLSNTVEWYKQYA